MSVINKVTHFVMPEFDVNIFAINHLWNLDKTSLCNFETSLSEYYGAMECRQQGFVDRLCVLVCKIYQYNFQYFTLLSLNLYCCEFVIYNNNVIHFNSWFINMLVQHVRKVAVHLQKVLEVMSTSAYTGLNSFNFICKHFVQICVRKVVVDLHKVLEVMSTSVYTGLNPYNFIRKHFLQICLWGVYVRSYCSF
jgi:hypothetical protein